MINVANKIFIEPSEYRAIRNEVEVRHVKVVDRVGGLFRKEKSHLETSEKYSIFGILKENRTMRVKTHCVPQGYSSWIHEVPIYQDIEVTEDKLLETDSKYDFESVLKEFGRRISE